MNDTLLPDGSKTPDLRTVSRGTHGPLSGRNGGASELRIKFTLALLFVIITIAVPGIIATRSLDITRARNERAEAASESLSAMLRLAVLGYSIKEEKRNNPAAWAKDRQRHIDSVRSQTANVDRHLVAEIRMLSQASFGQQDRARQIEQEVLQRDRVRRIGASMERMANGVDDNDWDMLTMETIKEVEREAREAHMGSVTTFESVKSTLNAALMIVSFGGLLALWWIQLQVIRPLRKLLRGTEAIAADDYHHRADVIGSSEFRAIMASFNTMAQRVDMAATHMRLANERLESEVARRTAELAATNRSLERANQMRREFLADASHELRTPLAILRSEAEITLRQPETSPEDLRGGLDRVVRLSALMGEMIDDMLYVARAEEPTLPAILERLDLARIVRESAEEFLRVIEADGGSIAVTEAPPEMWVDAEETRLRQVLRIVVDNAVCYSSEVPRVELALMREAGQALVTIRDWGDGIAPEEIPMLFQRFQRGNRREGKGQGLGLSIARTFTEAFGGTIEFDSKPGEGTTVSIRIPLAESTPGSGKPGTDDASSFMKRQP